MQGAWGESMRKSATERQRKGLLLRLRPWVKSIQEVEGRHGAMHACPYTRSAHQGKVADFSASPQLADNSIKAL